MEKEKPFKMEEVESEDSLVDVCQHNVAIVDAVAQQLKHYLKSEKVKKPFTSVKAWLRSYLTGFKWDTQSMDVLLHWCVGLSLFVDKFEPPPFVFEENEL